jgi:hypothetical protein
MTDAQKRLVARLWRVARAADAIYREDDVWTEDSGNGKGARDRLLGRALEAVGLGYATPPKGKRGGSHD